MSEIKSRKCRMCFERIIAVLLTNDCKLPSVNGDIHIDQIWNKRFADYKKKKCLINQKLCTRFGHVDKTLLQHIT